MELTKIICVGAGGALGSIGRYLVSGLVHRWLPFATFPWGTLAVNALGCFVIGLLGGLAGATVLRGVAGYGAHSRLHTARILRLSTDLPLVIEIVDTRKSIEEFMPLVDEVMHEGLATLEKVEIFTYRRSEERL